MRPDSNQPSVNRFPQVGWSEDYSLVAIALGSNLGNPQANLEEGLRVLQACEEIDILQISPAFWTEPVYWGNSNEFDDPASVYLNAAALLQTTLTPLSLMDMLLDTEAELGRIRTHKWASRPLDLDILLWEDRCFDNPETLIPHPRMSERAFVLVPLMAVVGHWHMPIGDRQLGPSIAQLAQTTGTEGVRIDRPITLRWPD